MAAASCNGAGGRLVSGWFPPHQRGLAMGVRQTAQPLGIALGALVIPELAERGPHAGLMFPAVACAVAAVVSVDRHRRPTAQIPRDGHPRGTGQPVSRVVGAVANPRGVGAADDAADGDRDVHARLADQKRRLVDRGRRRCDDGVAAARRAGPHPGRPLVRSDRLANATRRASSPRPPLRPCSCWRYADHRGSRSEVRADDRRLGDRGARQRVGGDRDHRIRRPVLERSRVGHPEHHPAPDGGRRSPAVRRLDQRGQVPAGMGAVRVVPAGGGAAGAGAPAAAGIGD